MVETEARVQCPKQSQSISLEASTNLLPTKDNLLVSKMVEFGKCSRCNSEEENIEHAVASFFFG